jgi:hypothetical protein
MAGGVRTMGPGGWWVAVGVGSGIRGIVGDWGVSGPVLEGTKGLGIP